MSDYQELEDARAETLAGISDCLSRLAGARYLLSPCQRLVIADDLRNVAQAFDHGDGERLRKRLSLARYTLVTLAGPNGRPLYRVI